MYNSKKILGIIAARSGSKGLPRKNILPLLKKPLIGWTIEQALKNTYLDRVIVSTDDEEIAEISKNYGAEVPFIRPKELASDNAKLIDVIMHAIDWLEIRNNFYDLIILLQPTSPLRTSKDIDAAVELLFFQKAQAIISVCEAEYPPCWANTLSLDGCMKDFLSHEIMNKNRQELSIFYRLNGAIYLAFCRYLKKHKSFLGNETYAYIMPKERSVDVDNKIDFKFAEFLLKNFGQLV